MNLFKSHFVYDRQKRSGILLFIGLILLGIGFFYFYEPEERPIISSEEALAMAQLQLQIDSLKVVELEKRKPKIFPFNPNFITDYKGYTLGMSLEEIDRLHRFRESDKWINSTADFKRVTQVSDSLLSVISPYFKFPEWVSRPKSTRKNNYKSKWKTPEEKGKLNKLNLQQLMAIDAMDSISADKILRHLGKLGGYQVDQQLYDVYGVSTAIKRAVLKEYTVKEKPAVAYIDVNTATASDLATIPLLNFDMAKEIVDYRILNEGIQSLDELAKLEGMTEYKLARIRLYLKLE